jgi:hypothetical protein
MYGGNTELISSADFARFAQLPFQLTLEAPKISLANQNRFNTTGPKSPASKSFRLGLFIPLAALIFLYINKFMSSFTDASFKYKFPTLILILLLPGEQTW